MRQLAQLTFSLGGSLSGMRSSCTVVIPSLTTLLMSRMMYLVITNLELRSLNCQLLNPEFVGHRVGYV